MHRFDYFLERLGETRSYIWETGGYGCGTVLVSCFSVSLSGMYVGWGLDGVKPFGLLDSRPRDPDTSGFGNKAYQPLLISLYSYMYIFLYVWVLYMGLGMILRLRVPLYVYVYLYSVWIYLYVASYLSLYFYMFIYIYS
jgi:hypothetical protein